MRYKVVSIYNPQKTWITVDNRADAEAYMRSLRTPTKIVEDNTQTIVENFIETFSLDSAPALTSIPVWTGAEWLMAAQMPNGRWSAQTLQGDVEVKPLCWTTLAHILAHTRIP